MDVDVVVVVAVVGQHQAVPVFDFTRGQSWSQRGHPASSSTTVWSVPVARTRTASVNTSVRAHGSGKTFCETEKVSE